MIDADKDLFVNPNTGRAFRVLPAPEGEEGGVVQVLIFSATNTETIAAGRLLVLQVGIQQQSMDDPPLGTVPATFALVEREEVFAPPPADAALWGGGYDQPVVVWPEVQP